MPARPPWSTIRPMSCAEGGRSRRGIDPSTLTALYNLMMATIGIGPPGPRAPSIFQRAVNRDTRVSLALDIATPSAVNIEKAAWKTGADPSF